MAVIVICLAPVMDPIAADITVTALAVWAMVYVTPLIAKVICPDLLPVV